MGHKLTTHKKLSKALPTKGWYGSGYQWLRRNAKYPRDGVEWDVRDIERMIESYRPLDMYEPDQKTFDGIFRRLWKWVKPSRL